MQHQSTPLPGADSSGNNEIASEKTPDVLGERAPEHAEDLIQANAAQKEEPEISIARYRSLADAMPQIVWTARPDGWMDYFNRRWYEYTGLSFEQTKGWGWGPVLHPDDLEKCLEGWKKSIRTGEPCENEYRLRRASDGTYRWHLGRAFPMRNEAGEILLWVGTCTDIDALKRSEEGLRRTKETLEAQIYARTRALHEVNQALWAEIEDRKQVEAALQQSEREGRGLFENAHDAILLISKNETILDVNQRACELYGYDHDEFIGMPLEEITQDPIQNQSLIATILEQDQDQNLETVHYRQDGTEMLLEIHAAAVEYQGRRAIMTINRDITERKRAEAELEQTALELLRSNQELEQFAYVTSHDLQEPLRTVSGYSQLLARRYRGQLDTDADEFIDFIVEGTARMQALIRDLLAYSRVGTHGRDLEWTDTRKALQRALLHLELVVEDTQAIITHDPLPTVMADGYQLAQLFQHLIGNALKFRGERQPEIHIGVKQQDGEWAFRVRDNGIGIEEQYAERIFVIFQRLHTREQYPGTGIGLAICKKIIERHKGRIWMESAPGEGTTFFFTLPV